MIRDRSASRLRMLLLTLIVGFTAQGTQAIGFDELLSRPLPKATERLAYGQEPDQFGELWMPGGAGPYPLVVMIHGGCWQASLPGTELMAHMAEDLRENGIAVWNIEYRRLGTKGAGYPGTFLDIADGMDYLREIAKTHPIDLSHIVVTGHSAGGQLALWAAARSRIAPQSPLYRHKPLRVQKVVTLAGINDLYDYRDNGPSSCGGADTIDELVGAKMRPAAGLYGDTSPAALLPIGVEQVIISGDADTIVPERFGSNYTAKAQKAGDHAKAINIKDADHFDLIDPESSAWRLIQPNLLLHTH